MVPIVVPVGMLMLKHFVCVLVTMAFRQVQYHSCQHQYPAQQHQQSRRAVPETEGHGSTGQLAATEKHLTHTTALLDQTLKTVMNVVNASLLTQHGLKPAEA